MSCLPESCTVFQRRTCTGLQELWRKPAVFPLPLFSPYHRFDKQHTSLIRTLDGNDPGVWAWSAACGEYEIAGGMDSGLAKWNRVGVAAMARWLHAHIPPWRLPPLLMRRPGFAGWTECGGGAGGKCRLSWG